jgi:hypothetical protein
MPRLGILGAVPTQRLPLAQRPPAATLAVPLGGRSRRDFYVKWVKDAHVRQSHCPASSRCPYLCCLCFKSLCLGLRFSSSIWHKSFHNSHFPSGESVAVRLDFLQMPCLNLLDQAEVIQGRVDQRMEEANKIDKKTKFKQTRFRRHRKTRE